MSRRGHRRKEARAGSRPSAPRVDGRRSVARSHATRAKHPEQAAATA